MKHHSWQEDSVVYQIYPRSFQDSNGDGIGDLNGITQRVPYLKQLGVDVLWLSPIFASPCDDNGYDISDYRQIMADFGTMEDFDRMLKEIHDCGMRLMLDLVVNHSSDEHMWFQRSRTGEEPYRDYYIWKPGRNGGPPNNWGAAFGGSAWEYDETRGEYYLHCFSKKQPDLNWENPAVRQEVYDLMTFWCDKGIDGFRMDVINMISKDPAYPDGETGGWIYGDNSPYTQNGPRIHEYLQEMNEKVLSKYDLMTVGETPGVTPELARQYTSEDSHELQMVFQFEHVGLDLCPRGQVELRRTKLTELKQVLSRWQEALDQDGWNSLYLSNHDQPRCVSRFGSQRYWERSAKTLATCIHMMKGTPYIYQGEELGMTNVPFPSIDDFRDLDTLNLYQELLQQGRGTPEQLLEFFRQRSRDNARTPMQWSDEPHAGFTTGTPWIMVNPNYPQINVERQLKDPNSIMNHYKELIFLRHTKEVVRTGRYRLLQPEREDLFMYLRETEDERMLVVCSFCDEEIETYIPLGFLGGKILLSTCGRTTVESTMRLEPWESLVVIG